MSGILVGDKFWIHGDWDDTPSPKGRFAITMPVVPIRAYGAGWNPTTKRCIEELERVVEPEMTVLDLGTGTGILAVVCFRLGVNSVYATENDPVMLAFAETVFKKNHMPSILSADHKDLPKVDLCVANIGDSLWDIQDTVKADVLFIVGNKSGEVEYASRP